MEVVVIKYQNCRTVVARNSVGEDRVSATLNVTGREGIQADAINQQSLGRIAEIEAPRAPQEAPADKQFEAPSITAQLTATPSDLEEGDSAHLVARISPIDDPNMKVCWQTV